MIFLMFISTLANCETIISYGTKKGQVAFVNQNSNPGIEEPVPLGPLAFAVTKNFFYVADSMGGALLQFHKKKGFVKELVITATPSEMLFDDLVLEIDNKKIKAFWLLEALSNSIIHINSSGKIISRITNEKFIQPFRIEISPSKLLYIADKGARKIFIMNKDGKLMQEMPWEWSGMNISPDADVLYRLFYSRESNTTFLVSSNLQGEITAEKELKLGEHFNSELWFVDETKQEILVTYATSQVYERKLIVAKVGFDGEIKSKSELTPPLVMNRFIAGYENELWIASGDFSKAPEGKLKIIQFKMP